MQFRTKARAVDLLGKGQIADLPTAITELWKNGYDAYAANLTAEIFQKGFCDLKSDLFLLTDDGKGMTQKDILEKWLVLGTDSKSRAELETKPDAETLWRDPRIKAGEKGIGRLSIAFLGQPMLMMTKKIGHPLQMLFFDWRLLENYNLYLDDINIPVRSLKSRNDFETTIQELKSEYLSNFHKNVTDEGTSIWEEKQFELKKAIIKSINQARLPTKIIDIILTDFLDIKESHGTKFLIFEPIDQILALAKEKEEEFAGSREFTISSLSGFFNPFIEIKNKVETFFFIHSILGKDRDLFNQEANFFTPSDFDLSDILIEGNFDGDGGFKGILKIYDQEIAYEYESPRRKFKKKHYGDVYIKLGYNQGKLQDSKLSETAFSKISKKVEKNGGLYIYRDNFRVLPYGRPSADFLRFEERRSKRAGTYYFSYRRMFGYLGITREKNPELKDKSSREGLIFNDPYSAFESDLVAFFLQLARDYFADKAEKSIFLDEKEKLNKQNQAIADDKKRETAEKKAFSKELSAYPDKFADYEKRYLNLIAKIEEKVGLVSTAYSDLEFDLAELQRLDLEFEHLLPEIPKRYKPTDLQLDRLNRYEEQIFAFKNKTNAIRPEIMRNVNDKFKLYELKKNFIKNAEVFNGELEELISAGKLKLQEKYVSIIDEYSTRATEILESYNEVQNRATADILTKEDIQEQSVLLKAEFDKQREIANSTLLPFVEHICKMRFDVDEELLQGAYKLQYDQMRQQWSMVQDTAQLGIAVEIIDHEFNVLYSRINRLLGELDNVSSLSTNNKYQLLEKTFRALEDKYNLLSPLYRINGAINKEIRCSNIVDYVKDFFAKQLQTEGIKITVTQAFLKHNIIIKEPTIYTVVINVINNAIYWVRNSKVKEIRFDYFDNTKEILILNSGRKIEEHRLNKIFDLFYSNRPAGRGIGLYLAKQSLNESYYDIEATNKRKYNYLNGACFVIKPIT
jgi:signal transduction histidine kinase